jgi:hypothetical protein
MCSLRWGRVPDMPINDSNQQLAMSKRSQRRATLDTAIVDAWNCHERTEPDISAERLFEMVRPDTVDVDRRGLWPYVLS